MIDGTTGELIVDPPDELTLARARARARSPSARAARPATAAGRAASPRDGVPVPSSANIEFPATSPAARECRRRRHRPLPIRVPARQTPRRIRSSEDEQYEVYRALLEGMAPGAGDRPDVRRRGGAARCRGRTVGQRRPSDRERAPAGGPLGLRAIRLSLARRELFRTQLRALLRAARHGSLRIMFPFVSGLEELREARALVAEAAAELEARGDGVAALPPIGVMIEIPSAARHRRPAGARGRLLHHRHERPDPVPASPSIAPMRACRGLYEPLHPGDAAHASASVVRAAARAAHAGVALRRDGVRSGAPAAAGRARPDRLQHEPGGDPGGRARCSRASDSREAGGWPRGSCDSPPWRIER